MLEAGGPIKLDKLNYKARANDVISAIQVVLTNNTSSQVFLGNKGNETAADMQTVSLNTKVKKIRGIYDGCCVTNIRFHDSNGNEIAKILPFASEFTPDRILEDDEELIGVWGHKDSDGNGYFHNPGFIVWKPPKF